MDDWQRYISTPHFIFVWKMHNSKHSSEYRSNKKNSGSNFDVDLACRRVFQIFIFIEINFVEIDVRFPRKVLLYLRNILRYEMWSHLHCVFQCPISFFRLRRHATTNIVFITKWFNFISLMGFIHWRGAMFTGCFLNFEISKISIVNINLQIIIL